MTTFLRQGDPVWASKPLGARDGAATIGRSGCLLTCVAQAARVMGTDREVTPAVLQDRCREAQAFAGADLIVHAAAPLVGLEAPWIERVRLDKETTHMDLAGVLQQALIRGAAILHVDHDSMRAGGDEAPDHFILAVELGDQTPAGLRWLYCADPATGELVTLPWPDLEGRATWGTPPRRYKVLAVRPIRRGA